ncbi:MAG TPA: S8/S53 family peptidase [Mucilaginibacter sp.]
MNSIRKKILGLLILICPVIKSYALVCLVDTSKTGKTDILFFDRSQLKPDQAATIIKALGIISDKNHYVTSLKVKPNSSLNLIVKQRFNIVDEKFHHMSKAIIEILAAANSLKSNKINVGQTLRIPKLPVNYAKGGTDTLTQLFDIYANKTYVSSTKALASYKHSNLQNIPSIQQARLFAYKLNREDLSKFIHLITEKLYNKLYGSGVIMRDTVKFLELKFTHGDRQNRPSGVNLQTIDTASISLIRHIDKKHFGKYYILDFYKSAQNCPHGNKVLDVIKAKFDEYGIDTAKANIIPIPVDYLNNEKAAYQFLEDYYAVKAQYPNEKKLQQTKRDAILNQLNEINKKHISFCPNCVPEVYLNALLKNYYNQQPDIISTSFYTTVIDNDLMPRFFTSGTNLVTAALDDEGRKIEDLMAVAPTPAEPVPAIEPLFSYFTNYGAAGCIIVGNRIKDGQFGGMYSYNGDRVTILGQGIGWNNNCITAEDNGTSFATPDVATQLYIAKAYWRSQNLAIDASEARTRLLLSSDIDPGFIGKFASGGMADLGKLLQIDQGYCVNKANQIVPVKFLQGSIIKFNGNSQLPFQRNTTVSGNKIDGICGLYIAGENYYAFFESSLSWRKIDIDQLSINIRIGDKDTPVVTKESLAQFKQIIILKN